MISFPNAKELIISGSHKVDINIFLDTNKNVGTESVPIEGVPADSVTEVLKTDHPITLTVLSPPTLGVTTLDIQLDIPIMLKKGSTLEAIQLGYTNNNKDSYGKKYSIIIDQHWCDIDEIQFYNHTRYEYRRLGELMYYYPGSPNEGALHTLKGHVNQDTYLHRFKISVVDDLLNSKARLKPEAELKPEARLNPPLNFTIERLKIRITPPVDHVVNP